MRRFRPHDFIVLLGNALIAPPGFIFLVDGDGAYLLDADGAYLVEPI